MKKTNNYLPRLITVALAILLVLTSLAACKQKPTDSSSISELPDSSKTVTEDTLSSEAPIESEEESTIPSSSEPAPSSTPTANTPSPSSTPAPVVSSEPDPKPIPDPKPEVPAKKTPQELIIGKWEGYYDVASEFADLGFTVDGNSKIKAGMEFTSSGSVIVTLDEATFKNLMRPILTQTMEELKQHVMQENNMTSEEYDAAFLQDYEMTIPEYIEETLTIYDNLTEVSEYKFAGDVLLIKDTTTGQFVESEYSFPNENTLIAIENGIQTTYTRVS